MNIFYALLQQQKVHLLHRPSEELQQWPGTLLLMIIYNNNDNDNDNDNTLYLKRVAQNSYRN